MLNVDLVRINRALASVTNKNGLVLTAQTLHRTFGVMMISTGGTSKEIKGAQVPVLDVADLTGFPEMLDGRLKTLHPKVHGGLLGKINDLGHEQAMAAHGIRPIELLMVNLYAFETKVAEGASFEDCIENIDIGGPAMIRAAAKNHESVVVIVDPKDYPDLLAELTKHDGATTLAFRKKMAAKAYAHTAAYDAVISNWFAEQLGDTAPQIRAFSGKLIQKLRYGENPHQHAAFYKSPEQRFGVASARQVHGKELSYNNINDADGAFECVAEFGSTVPTVAIIKHANPCGVGQGKTLIEAYHKALDCDRTSAFGGIVTLNQDLDAETARLITQVFTEVIIAPSATEEACWIVGENKKGLRLLLTGGLPDQRAPGLTFKSVAGGLLVQSRDNEGSISLSPKVVTKRGPTADEERDLYFAWKVAKHVKSNAIVYAKDLATVGIGAGQMSRVDSARIAARKAEDATKALKLPQLLTKGSVVASDAFFPFPDGMIACIEAGATAVIQPGGSVNDQKVIDAANELNAAMVFTGVRHFRHS